MTSMYQTSSFDQAGITRDYQMVPKSPDLSTTFNEVTTPAELVVQEKPNYVIINKVGTYKFLYETTCSIGGTSGETFKTGIKLTADGPLTLPIQPYAWDQDGGTPATGDVTFVYVRVR